MSFNIRKRIIVTGANGLLGRNAILQLSQEHEVHAVVRKYPEYPVPEVIYHLLDFTSEGSFETLPKQIDAVFHLAQSDRMKDFPEGADDIFQVNLASTAKLLEYARVSSAKHFIYTSTGGLYGSGPQAFAENSPLCIPDGALKFYFDTKYCSEKIVKNYVSLMNIIVLRPFFIYGLNQNRAMLIPRLINRIREGMSVSLQGKSGIRLNPIHVNDAVNALCATLNLFGEHTINIGGPEIITIKSLAEAIGRALDKKVNFELLEGDPQDVVADITLMNRLLSKPMIRIDHVLKELVSL